MKKVIVTVRERLRLQTEREITRWLFSGLDPRKLYELLVRNLWAAIGIRARPRQEGNEPRPGRREKKKTRRPGSTGATIRF